MVQAEGRTFAFVGEEAIRPDFLETFEYRYPQREAEITIESDEWNCVCPFSGLPDFGRLVVRYVPDRLCLELKSLKYYLTSFRHVGIYQEHAAARILEDLVQVVQPKRMVVTLDYRVRGGLHTVVTVCYPETTDKE